MRYLINDAQVTDAASAYAGRQPAILLPARQAADFSEEEPSQGWHRVPDDRTDTAADPDRLLLMVLCDAPEEGTTVAELVEITGMSRATVYRRLRTHADNGNAVQLGDGRWRCP